MSARGWFRFVEAWPRRYKFGMTLAAIASIRYASENFAVPKELDESSEPSRSSQELVADTTDILAPALLPMIDILGELDIEDVRGLVEMDTATPDDDAA